MPVAGLPFQVPGDPRVSMAVRVPLGGDVTPEVVLMMGFQIREEAEERLLTVSLDKIYHHLGQCVHAIAVEVDALACFVIHEPLIRL
jgi:hypothetical protein